MQKYTILVQYHKAGENSAMQGTSHEGYGSGEDTEIVEVDGKKYRKVQIFKYREVGKEAMQRRNVLKTDLMNNIHGG